MSTTRNTNQSANEMAAAGARELPVLVWKFGGTSVKDQDRLRAVAERMVEAQRSGRRVVAVLSAMGKTTDELSGMAYQMSSRPQMRELDALLSVGEQISCALASMAVHELGSRAVSFNGAQAGILTDGAHGNARLRDVCPERITAALNDGAIALVTGFQGVSPDGAVTTLGRGGSDASAVAVAAALGVHECEIFTDVPAVFTADPRVVPNARRIHELRHEEMLEMAEAGAGVLQPRSVELAAAHGVDIHLRSSYSTEQGTWIRRGGSAFEDAEVAGVAHRRQEPLYAVTGISAAELTLALAERGAAIGTILPADRELRFSVPGVEAAEVAAAIGTLGAEVSTHRELGTVSVVSLGIARKPALVARALRALTDAGIEPEFVTTSTGRVTVHVASSAVDDAVRLLHETFIERTERTQGNAALAAEAARPTVGSTRAKAAVNRAAEFAVVRAAEAAVAQAAEGTVTDLHQVAPKGAA
ncbi:MAG: aspartate kinase [Pseudonocardiales bacterium]|nr:aspartate kinase [Pseudonocardiales bacterium]